MWAMEQVVCEFCLDFGLFGTEMYHKLQKEEELQNVVLKVESCRLSIFCVQNFVPLV